MEGFPLLSDPKHTSKSHPLSFYVRALYLRRCIESLMQRQEFKYGVRFEECGGATEFAYCWQIMLAKN